MMTQSEPDYSQYNLDQLYDIYRNINRERFPERAMAVQQQILLKAGRLPEVRNHPPCSLLRCLGAPSTRFYYRPTTALKAARVIVGLEYGAGIFFMVLPSILFGGAFFFFSFIIWAVFYLLFCSGVAILKKYLHAINDERTVELWSLIALGIAPFSAILYVFIAGSMLDQMAFNQRWFLLFCFLVLFAGFYTPFILASFWVRYHCREDEF